MELVWPHDDYLDGYMAALEAGWSPSTMRAEAAAEQLALIVDEGREAFVASQVDREAAGAPIRQADGTYLPRLPGFSKWVWDGEFCGSVNLRWQKGTAELPPHVLGHIGYTIVPNKRRLGYATKALRLLLPDAKAEGLAHVDLTTDLDNIPSQRVIEHNGGEQLRLVTSPYTDGAELILWRIEL